MYYRRRFNKTNSVPMCHSTIFIRRLTGFETINTSNLNLLFDNYLKFSDTSARILPFIRNYNILNILSNRLLVTFLGYGDLMEHSRFVKYI